MFNHDCKGTFTVPAEQFKELYDGPIFSTRATGKDDCNKYCLLKDELRSCPVQCECAYVREIITIIKNWPKHQDVQNKKTSSEDDIRTSNDYFKTIEMKKL